MGSWQSSGCFAAARRNRPSPIARAARRGWRPYRDGAIFTTKFAGKGTWERHPKGDELVHILDGAATLDIAHGDELPQSIALSAGMMAVIPQGAWHRFR